MRSLRVALIATAAAGSAAAVRTGVLVHGCHCGAAEWERVVYGDPAAGLLGRIPTALLAAAQCDATTLIFGTGASTHENGLAEAEATLALARERCPLLSRDFPDHFAHVDLERLGRLLERAIADTRSSSTTTELREAAARFRRLGCTRLLLVSSPTHLPRVLRDAPSALQAEGLWPLPPGGLLMGVPSDTAYAGAGDVAADVAVVEPPHLPRPKDDAAEWPLGERALHRLVARALRLPPAKRAVFARDVDRLLRQPQ